MLALIIPTNQAAAAQPIYPNLPAEIQQLLRSKGMSPWGMSAYVQAIGSPRPLISHNAQIARNPASVMKLLTAYVAIGVLGPNYRWPIEISTNGNIQEAFCRVMFISKVMVHLTLILKVYVKCWANLDAKVFTRFNGRLIFDDTHFNGPKIDPGAFDGKPYSSYNAQPDALMFNERRSTFSASRQR